MLHINRQARYQRIWESLKTTYVLRGTNQAHYIAGVAVGAEIARGVSDAELANLSRLFEDARNAKR